MKKVLKLLVVLLVLCLSGCSVVQQTGEVKVYDYTDQIQIDAITEAEQTPVCEDIIIVFADEYVPSRHLGNNWIIVITPVEVTVHHNVYDDETCAVMANTVAKAAAGLDNYSALLPVTKAAAKKARAIAIEEAAYTVFVIGFIAFLALTFMAGMISDRVPSNSFAGRVSGAFLGFAVGLLASGRGSHKSSSFGGSSGGSATVRR